MDANPQFELLFRPVVNFEVANGFQECQGHAGNLAGVQSAVANR